MDGEVHLGRPTLIRARAQPVPDHLLELVDRRLGSRPRRVAGCPLPGHAAVLGDILEMSVPLRGRSLGRVARHGGRAQRDDDRRFGGALGSAGVDAVLVVPAVAGERGNSACDPIEQGADGSVKNLGQVAYSSGSDRPG